MHDQYPSMKPARRGRVQRAEPTVAMYAVDDFMPLRALREFLQARWTGHGQRRQPASDERGTGLGCHTAVFMARILGPGWGIQAGGSRQDSGNGDWWVRSEGGFYDGRSWRPHCWTQHRSGLLIDLTASQFGAHEFIVSMISTDTRYKPNSTRVECYEAERRVINTVVEWLELWRSSRPPSAVGYPPPTIAEAAAHGKP